MKYDNNNFIIASRAYFQHGELGVARINSTQPRHNHKQLGAN